MATKILQLPLKTHRGNMCQGTRAEEAGKEKTEHALPQARTDTKDTAMLAHVAMLA